MKLTEARLTKGLTLNLGNYESARIECGLTLELDPQDELAEALDLLRAEIDARLELESRGFKS